jgi:hypothetical protein
MNQSLNNITAAVTSLPVENAKEQGPNDERGRDATCHSAARKAYFRVVLHEIPGADDSQVSAVPAGNIQTFRYSGEESGKPTHDRTTSEAYFRTVLYDDCHTDGFLGSNLSASTTRPNPQ